MSHFKADCFNEIINFDCKIDEISVRIHKLSPLMSYAVPFFYQNNLDMCGMYSGGVFFLSSTPVKKLYRVKIYSYVRLKYFAIWNRTSSRYRIQA